MYAVESDIALEMLAVKEGYRYEYQGDCVQPVWYKTLEKTIYNFFTAFSMKYFPLLNGTFSCGKSTALIETCRLIAQNLVTRNITSVSEPKVIEKVSFHSISIINKLGFNATRSKLCTILNINIYLVANQRCCLLGFVAMPKCH